MTHPVSDLHTTSAINPRSLWLSIAMLAMAAVLWIVQIGDYLNGTIDDVFITLRVANNVTEGNGYVYNVGENIEGYSNWSWVTLISLTAKATGATEASIKYLWISKILALSFSLLALVVIYLLTKRLTDSNFFASASVHLTLRLVCRATLLSNPLRMSQLWK